MGFDVELRDENGKMCIVTKHKGGSIYVIGGNDEAEMSITYNYSHHYYEHLDSKDGLRWLNKKKAKDTIEKLETSIDKLGTERTDDYWEDSPGNAGHILAILIKWAESNPDGIWKVI